jgi:para-aminobenzoate synthetase component 1
VLFDFDGIKNYQPKSCDINLHKYPIAKTRYKIAYDRVLHNISLGNCYLFNLTFATPITIDKSLKDIFLASNAKFKFYHKDSFVCFSPERFVKIEDNKIYTYPMKGTIDSTIENAKEKILNDKKELAEHTMVVDLLRNDLGSIGSDVKVEEFRYIDKIDTDTDSIYQVSSKISAKLEDNWQERLGDIIDTILPAGSITGTPKHKVVELIDKIEDYDRGYFSGICGYFDGDSFDSGVMIRFIEQNGDKYIYKSGGGITSDSDLDSEYKEMIKKIYITKKGE